ncbi:MAG TPA: hypothetical protein VEY51_16465 [Chondromyces sp.]|nr:hypothetical protein [Chondromyces sp.]
MSFAIILVIMIAILSGVFTLLLAGKSDENYRNNTGRNATNLTLIYAVAIILSLAAVGAYIIWFT